MLIVIFINNRANEELKKLLNQFNNRNWYILYDSLNISNINLKHSTLLLYNALSNFESYLI